MRRGSVIPKNVHISLCNQRIYYCAKIVGNSRCPVILWSKLTSLFKMSLIILTHKIHQKQTWKFVSTIPLWFSGYHMWLLGVDSMSGKRGFIGNHTNRGSTSQFAFNQWQKSRDVSRSPACSVCHPYVQRVFFLCNIVTRELTTFTSVKNTCERIWCVWRQGLL